MRPAADIVHLNQLRRHARPSTLAAARREPAKTKKGVLHRAKILTPAQFQELRGLVEEDSKTPERDLVGILLSFYCGLRAQEIAYLEWDRHILDAKGRFRTTVLEDGTVQHTIFISGDIGKRGRERTLPIPPQMVQALKELRALRQTDVHVFHRLDCPPGYGPLLANSVAKWFGRIYERYNYDGCSSHSGRRTFVTQAARKMQFAGCSLRDVQIMAGHASLATTQAYIEPSEQQGALVSSLYD
ncbi:tyrosine recombinase [Caulobacter phage CcrBL9]|uniref:Integrase n=1 Tax=Caulobacter phage CcrBL9 TaxID=2283270 RepID=A0A385EBS8_9CAUD|nr:tyrosine recombinase [Caulobacter phage CcrBL9]AXQ69243.1 tyrosine recombinase [Caulobacter phage CcrBL9]